MTRVWTWVDIKSDNEVGRGALLDKEDEEIEERRDMMAQRRTCVHEMKVSCKLRMYGRKKENTPSNLSSPRSS